MNWKKWAPIIFTAFAIFAGALVFWGPQIAGWLGREVFAPKKIAFDHASHPAKKLSFWSKVIERPLERRLIDAPPILVDYISKDNKFQGWSEEPRSVHLEGEFKEDLRMALVTLPEPVKKKLEESLAFITIVRELGGSAYSDQLLTDEKSPAPVGFIVIDVEALNRKANEWATWKENSPFKQDGSTKLTATIEEPTDDTRRQAIQYILLHEIGHVVHFSLPTFPSAHDELGLIREKMARGFPGNSWRFKAAESRETSIFDGEMPWRKFVTYYSSVERQLPISQARSIYADLASTNFPTLYAATNFRDDFADSFASFVHTELMGKPWEIRIESPGEQPLTYGSCWKEPRCKSKRLILESVLGL